MTGASHVALKRPLAKDGNIKGAFKANFCLFTLQKQYSHGTGKSGTAKDVYIKKRNV